ncbi:hypothetical protein BH11PLA2_BH11PLA2_49010 [soil metagenome]
MRSWLLVPMLICGCASPEPPAAKAPPMPPEKLTLPGCENTFRVTPNLYSGGTPENDSAFKVLAQLGIKSIISVDGAAPEHTIAAKHGLKYVHLPVGYDGISTDTAYKLAKAVQSLPGPVYVHCHHGKHRGPAAVAAIRLCLEPEYTPADASQWMTAAGTDPKYKGLTRLPLSLVRPKSEQLQSLSIQFPVRADVPDMTRVMVNVDVHWDAIKDAKARNIMDIEAAAVLLVEDYRELKRSQLARAKGEIFMSLLAQAESDAQELVDVAKANNQLAIVEIITKCQNNCGKCHTRFRD